jgi:RNA polymerase sigma-70 factor (ECF subfamily)
MPLEGAVNEPDPQDVDAARRGDTRAFARLVRTYQADVWRFAYQILGDRDLADDVAQDAFVRAFRFLRRYRGDARFSTWLFSITRNCAMDELRRSARRARIEVRATAERQISSDLRLRVEVREALAGLPLDLRAPVVLIDMFGLSYREVASVLGLAEGTVKSRVHRARHTLAEALSPEDREGSGEA